MKFLGGSQFGLGPLYYPFFGQEEGTPEWARHLQEGVPFSSPYDLASLNKLRYVVQQNSSPQLDDMIVKCVESSFLSDAEQAAYFATDRMFRIASAIASSQQFQDFVSNAEHIGRKTGKLSNDVIKSGEHTDLTEGFDSCVKSDPQLNNLTLQLARSLDAYKQQWLAVVESTPLSDGINPDPKGDDFFSVWEQLEIHAAILAKCPLPVAPGVIIKDRIRETQSALNGAINNWIQKSKEALGDIQISIHPNHLPAARARRL